MNACVRSTHPTTRHDPTRRTTHARVTPTLAFPDARVPGCARARDGASPSRAFPDARPDARARGHASRGKGGRFWPVDRSVSADRAVGLSRSSGRAIERSSDRAVGRSVGRRHAVGRTVGVEGSNPGHARATVATRRGGRRRGAIGRASSSFVRAGARVRDFMLCAISGTTPTTPVVTPRGIVYERSLIVKAIEVRRRRRRGRVCARRRIAREAGRGGVNARMRD